MPIPIVSEDQLKPGDFFEDSAYHPCLAVSIKDGCVDGISLVDGSYPRNDGILQNDLRKLTWEEVFHWKIHGPPDIPPQIPLTEDQKYWLPIQKQLKKDGLQIPDEQG